jgi:putative phosphoribosyl transferase
MHPETAVSIPAAGVTLQADLVVPVDAVGVVLFAHGSGSSRRSPRNRMVASRLHDDGFATVLADLLTAEEERYDARTAELRFDIRLLAQRMVGIVDWTRNHSALAQLSIGLFGASTGAAAALVAAAERPDDVRAVVSRGGRPDLAGEALRLVRAPTLLIVGGADTQVLELNQRASGLLSVPTRIHIVPGATHLFEEPGALEEVASQAADWFAAQLGARTGPRRPS